MEDEYEAYEVAEAYEWELQQKNEEIERLRDAIKAAIENIDADDVIGAHDKLREALGEKE